MHVTVTEFVGGLASNEREITLNADQVVCAYDSSAGLPGSTGLITSGNDNGKPLVFFIKMSFSDWQALVGTVDLTDPAT